MNVDVHSLKRHTFGSMSADCCDSPLSFPISLHSIETKEMLIRLRKDGKRI
jgi:hypothetical protein